MLRRTPLRRKSALRASSRTSSYAKRERDIAFMLWVKRQPCCVRIDPPDPARTTPCFGAVEADHLGARGVGRKADDRTCAPLCMRHHNERTSHTGSFWNLTRDALRPWRARAMLRTTEAWLHVSPAAKG